MVRKYYRADYINPSGEVLASYSFQAETFVKAKKEAQYYKRSLGCDVCSNTSARVTLIAKVDTEETRVRKRKPKHGITRPGL